MSSLDEQIQKNLDEHDRLMETDEVYNAVYELSKMHMKLLSNEEMRSSEDYRKAIADAMRLDAQLINKRKIEMNKVVNTKEEDKPTIEEEIHDEEQEAFDKLDSVFVSTNGKYRLPIGVGISLSIILLFIKQLALPELSALIIILPLVLEFVFAMLIYFVHQIIKTSVVTIIATIDAIRSYKDKRQMERLKKYAECLNKINLHSKEE